MIHDELDWSGIKKRIEGAVKEGEVTREQADAKYRELKERAAGGKKGDGIDLEAKGRKLKEAVKAGTMTEIGVDSFDCAIWSNSAIVIPSLYLCICRVPRSTSSRLITHRATK